MNVRRMRKQIYDFRGMRKHVHEIGVVGNISKRILRTVPDAFHTKDTFRAVFPLSGIIGHVYIHRTYLFAFAAGNALLLIAFHPKQRKVTHRFQEYCDRTNVFAECPVILKGKRQGNPDSVICHVSDNKSPEHDPFDISGSDQKQRGNENKRSSKCDIPDPSDLFTGILRDLIRKKIEHHGRPTGISAPSPSEQQRAEYFGDCIMDRRRFKYSGEKIIPEALYLHILITDKSKIDQHVKADQQLHDAPGIFIFPDEQEYPQRYGQADIAEIEKIKQIILCQPQRHCYCFKYCQHHHRRQVFFQVVFSPFSRKDSLYSSSASSIVCLI